MSEDKSEEVKAEDEDTESSSSEASPSALSPEEQMARYEEALKEDDRGHQPC